MYTTHQSKLPVLMEVHAANGGGVAGEDLEALAGLGVPDAERTVRGAADDQVAHHLRGPDAARVAH